MTMRAVPLPCPEGGSGRPSAATARTAARVRSPVDAGVGGAGEATAAAPAGSGSSGGEGAPPEPSYRDRGSWLDQALHLFHGKRHPDTTGGSEVSAFLSSL